MKVSHLSFSTHGGAGIVAGRLISEQKKLGLFTEFRHVSNSTLYKEPWANPAETISAAIDNKILVNAENMFSITRSRISRQLVTELDASEVIHLHWIEGVIRDQELVLLQKLGKKIIWTLHDMRPFTGGCHFSGNCMRFMDSCMNCPVAKPLGQRLISKNLRLRLESGLLENAVFVAPSDWILEKFEKSSVGGCARVVRINNPGIPKQSDGISASRVDAPRGHWIAVAADWGDPRKGLFDLLSSWEQASVEDVILTIVGQIPSNISLPKGVRPVGEKAGEQVQQLMRQADLLVLPSHQENAPLVIAEARSLGLPIIVRSGIGASEFVRNGVDGAHFRDVSELSQVVVNLSRGSEIAKIKLESANLVENFEPNRVAQQYLELYEELI